MGKTDLLLEVIETFIIRVRVQILNIKQYLSANNYNSIFTEAHAIKGGAGNLGAFNLSKAAAELAEEPPADRVTIGVWSKETDHDQDGSALQAAVHGDLG